MKKLITSICVAMMFLFSAHTVKAQEEAAATTETASEDSGKKDLNVEITYRDVNDTLREIQAKLTTKEGKKWVPARKVLMNLFLNEVSRYGMQGSLASDEKGICRFPLVNKFYHVKDSCQSYNFIARVREDMNFNDADAEIAIKESKMSMTCETADGVKTAKIHFEGLDESNKMVPMKDVELRFYIQRTYSLLPLSEANVSTDENGDASIEVPEGIAGDEKGNITIIARLEDNETYGMVMAQQQQAWGKPTIIQTELSSGELWASRANAPAYLVIGVNAMLLGIWGTIFYIIFILFRVIKIGAQFKDK